MIRRLSLVAGWLVLAFIACATLSPIEDRPVIAHPQFEHFAAFALMGLAFVRGYPKHPLLLVIVVVMASAFTLEALQSLTPDRHGRVLDALVKAAGGICGIGVGRLGPLSWRDHVHRLKSAFGSARRPG